MFLYSLQPEGENLVTLEDTSASAVLQKDGTVVCTHELLSPIGLFHSMLIKVKELFPSPYVQITFQVERKNINIVMNKKLQKCMGLWSAHMS